MKMIAILAACLSWNAGAVEISFGGPLPCDPSGYPLLTNDPARAVLMLQARVSRLEAWAVSNMVKEAKIEEERLERERARRERAEKEEERRRVNLEFNRWITDQRAKYGRMTLVDYDTNTCERVYRRMDGVTVRKKCYDGSEERKVRAPRGRVKKGGAK